MHTRRPSCTKPPLPSSRSCRTRAKTTSWKSAPARAHGRRSAPWTRQGQAVAPQAIPTRKRRRDDCLGRAASPTWYGTWGHRKIRITRRNSTCITLIGNRVLFTCNAIRNTQLIIIMINRQKEHVHYIINANILRILFWDNLFKRTSWEMNDIIMRQCPSACILCGRFYEPVWWKEICHSLSAGILWAWGVCISGLRFIKKKVLEWQKYLNQVLILKTPENMFPRCKHPSLKKAWIWQQSLLTLINVHKEFRLRKFNESVWSKKKNFWHNQLS